MVMRWRYHQLGGHIHVRVFTAKAKNMTFANCGELTFDEREWNDVRDLVQSAVELVPDDDREPIDL